MGRRKTNYTKYTTTRLQIYEMDIPKYLKELNLEINQCKYGSLTLKRKLIAKRKTLEIMLENASAELTKRGASHYKRG